MSSGYWNPLSGFEKSELFLYLIYCLRAFANKSTKSHRGRDFSSAVEESFPQLSALDLSSKFLRLRKVWISRIQLPSLLLAVFVSQQTGKCPPEGPELTHTREEECFIPLSLYHLMIFKTFGKINQVNIFCWGGKQTNKMTCQMSGGCSSSINHHLIPLPKQNMLHLPFAQ